MRVLIVDDDEPFAHMLGEQLHRLEPTFDFISVATADAARGAIRDVSVPFDVFLVDQRLDGSDVDGVTLISELLRSSRDSGAIIFTGYDDWDTKQTASRAGAYWYLSKPFQTWDLIHVLRQLHERNRLKSLNQIAAEMQSATTEQDVADAIVHGALRFGFLRARLRLFSKENRETAEDQEMIGVSQSGNVGLEGFRDLRVPLTKLLYSQRAIAAGQPLFFRGRELGPGGVDEFFAPRGFRPPVGEWVKIPILNGENRIGSLTLDNADQVYTLEPQQRDQLTLLLGLFGKQAAAALERARLFEQANRQAEEAKILSNIGRQVTTQASKGNLDDLLDEVRRQLGSLMDVSNFMVVLSDLETEALDFRRQYEETRLVRRHWRAASAGLSGHVISRNRPCLIQDTKVYCETHGVAQYGPPSACWLGVPLRVEDHAVGAIVVQSYRDVAAYSRRHEQLLLSIAEQVAGAIQMAYRLERQAEQARQSSTPNELNKVLPGLIQESEDNFWHAVLTAITHRDGHSFNRAQLLWYDENGTQMQGLMGIGHFTRKDARDAWEEDSKSGQSLQEYLGRPHLARLKPTPLQQAVMIWNLKTGGRESPCYQVRARGQRRVLSSMDLVGCLPDELLRPPDLLDNAPSYECALVPVKSGTRVLGLLVVDNAFDGEPLRPGDLDRLEQLLGQAMQVWCQARETGHTQRLGESYEKILALNRQIMAQAASQPLKASLEDLCCQAQVLTQADCVVIYPYLARVGGYDLDLVSHVGLKQEGKFQVKTKNKPRQQGVTFSILQSGALVVPDVSRSDLSFGGRRLAKHDFLRREEIKALIGAPVRKASTGEPLGVIYLDYRAPQKFTEQDIARAEHIAAVGATAISYAREMERETRGRTAAETGEQRRRRDMQLLSNIQMQALSSDSDEEKVVRAILQNAAELFGRLATATLAILKWESSGQETRQVRQDFHLSPLGRLRKKRVDRDQGPIGQALHQTEPYLAGNVLASSIRLGQQPIGALLLQKLPKKAVFAAVDEEIIERLVTVAALALDNVRTRAYLQTVSQTVGAVSDLSGLEDTLNAVVAAARKVAPDIDCVTLWYEDSENEEELVAGPQWGINQDKHRGKNAHTDRVVRQVMKRRTPLFAPVAEQEECLRGDFIRDEGIFSVAAFPLRFGDKPHALGSLFLNYRKVHEFTPTERTLFPVFANTAATAIHDEQAIELAERRRKRLATAMAVSTKAGASLDMDEVLRGVLTTLHDEFQRGASDETAPYIMLYDDREKVLELPPVAREFYQPDRPEYQERVRLALDGQGITCRTACRALAAGKIVVDNVKDVLADPDYVEVNSRTRSELCAGLVSDKRLLGALVIKSSRPGALDAEDEKLFEMAAQQVAIALDRLERAALAQRHASVAGAMAWAADIAHDINSDVGYIRNRAYWLREREKNLSGQGMCWAREIEDRARQLADAVRAARFQRDEPNAFSLEEMLREKTMPWRVKYAPNVEIRIEANTPCMVRVHREQLWRAVRHLLRNALEAMEAAKSTPQQITLRLLPVGSSQVELQVEDMGPGVADEGRRRILRELYSTKDEEGSGVGLLIAQRLIESMGGSIYLYPSAPDRGARFAIRLPLADQKAQEEHHVHN